MRTHAPRKKLVAILLTCLVVGGLTAFAVSQLKAPLTPIKPATATIQALLAPHTTLSWPAAGQAAIGASSYGVLATNGAQTPVPTASIAKVITALAVLKAKPVAAGQQGAIITLSQNDVDIHDNYEAIGGSVAAVAAGEQITQYQALQAIMLPSANNMADSLAIWAFGSLTAYADYANKMVADLGLKNTHIGTDASGLSPTTTSTASDLVTLGVLAVNNPIIAEIVSQKSATIPVAGTVNNVNWLLGDNGINGVKTGNSDEAGGAFLFSAPYEVAPGHSVTIIGAVMKADNLSAALSSASPLLVSAQQDFAYATTIAAGQAVTVYTAPWGEKVTAVAGRNVKSLTWQGKSFEQPTVTLTSVVTPAKGAVVGKVSVGPATSGNDTFSPVVLSQGLNGPSAFWRLTH